MRLRLAWFRTTSEVTGGDWFHAGVDWLSGRLAHESDVVAFVADTGTELVAMATGHTAPRLPAPDGRTLRGRIDSAFTLPGHRCQGLATQCVNAVKGWLEDRGVAVIEVTCGEEAVSLYAGLGFTLQPGTHLRWTPRAGGTSAISR
jgi:GNAT superfamily N-acetyltransferase